MCRVTIDESQNCARKAIKDINPIKKNVTESHNREASPLTDSTAFFFFALHLPSLLSFSAVRRLVL